MRCSRRCDDREADEHDARRAHSRRIERHMHRRRRELDEIRATCSSLSETKSSFSARVRRTRVRREFIHLLLGGVSRWRQKRRRPRRLPSRPRRPSESEVASLKARDSRPGRTRERACGPSSFPGSASKVCFRARIPARSRSAYLVRVISSKVLRKRSSARFFAFSAASYATPSICASSALLAP